MFIFIGILGGFTTFSTFSRLSEDLPVVIEIVDSEENLKKLMPFLDETVKEGLVTLEKARVIKYRHSAEG